MTLSPSRSFKNFADSPNGRPSSKCIPSTITFRTVFPMCFLLLFGASIYFYMRITSQASFNISLSPILELSTTNSPYFSRQWLQTQSKQLSQESDKYHPGISHKELMNMDPFSLSTGINVWDLYPPQLSCPDVMRIGKVGEGGKWVCGIQHLSTISDCVMYSFGISTDMSFEVEILLRTNCIIHAFDPTVGKLPYHNLRPELLRAMTPQQRARIRFHKTAMGTRSGSSQIHSFNEQFYDIMHRLGHSFVHLLKVDIEGGEWAVFNSLFHDPAHRAQAHRSSAVAHSSHSKTPSLPVGQLIIELHYHSMEAIEQFFSGAESFGLLPFSREINLQPCLGGGQPVAAEYSFLHVDNYFAPSHTTTTTVKTVSSLPVPYTQSWHTPIRAVIYFLTQRTRTSRMAGALQLLYENFWVDYPHYPIVIFHDDLRPVDERTLQAAVPNMKLRFVAITLELPETLRNSKVHIPERTLCAPGSSTLGYRHMCRFHATLVHTYMKQLGYAQYDYIMRLDDDSAVTFPIGYDIFRFMRENKKEYAFTNMVADEPACVVDLWEQSEVFYNSTIRDHRNHSSSALFPSWPRGVVFYNNFEISAMSLWESQTWRQYMQYIDELGGIYTLRWGDAPLHTIGVTMILDTAQIHAFTDIGYRHDPFIDQSPAGLPMPQMDPFVGPNVACHYYDKWMCFYTHGGQNITNNGTHNSSVSLAFNGSYSLDSLPHNQQLRQIHYINVTSTAYTSKKHTTDLQSTAAYSVGTDKSVLYTFAHGGREDLLARTLNSFYEHYLRLHSAPVVVFYSDRGGFREHRLRELLAQTSIFSLLVLQPVELTNTTGLFATSPCMSLDEELNSASLFLQSRTSALLKARGFQWLLRFGDDSQLTATVTYNLFERMHSEGKVYGYVTAMEHRAECMQGLWETARRLCGTVQQEKTVPKRRLRKSNSHRSAGSLAVGTPNDLVLSAAEECTDLFPTWPGNKVILTNFEVSHVSVWESPQCKRLFASIDGQSPEAHSGKPPPLWADSVVHTVCVVTSLQASQVAQLSDIPYRFSWDNVAKSDADPENRMTVHLAEAIGEYDRAFGAQRLGWLGGDVAASVALPNERDRLAAPTKMLWLFGDSIVGVSSADRSVLLFFITTYYSMR